MLAQLQVRGDHLEGRYDTKRSCRFDMFSCYRAYITTPYGVA